MKARYLSRVALALIALDALFFWALACGGTLDLWNVMLPAVAGAVGAMLASAFKLRDAISQVNQLRALGALLVVQPLLGVASALLLVLAFGTRVITVGEAASAWATRGLLGFVAGFSEPFLLKVVAKVTSLGESKA
jgi:hypothetical protein